MFVLSNLRCAAIFFYMVATTVAFAVTTIGSRGIIEALRLGSVVLTALITAYLFIACRASVQSLRFAVLPCLALLAYGFSLSILNNAFSISSYHADYNIPILLAGVYLFSSQTKAVIPKGLVLALLCYSGAMFCLTVFSGGFEFAYPYGFVLQYDSLVTGLDIAYSQGVSKFYGLACLYSIFIAVREKMWPTQLAFTAIAFFFLILSLLGGARGDSVATAIILVVYVLLKFGKVGVAVVVGLMCTLLYWADWTALEDLVLVKRLSAMGEQGAGIREVLAEQTFALIVGDPICWFFGRGFGFFQAYYHHDAGLYPHNLLFEAVLSFGFPLVALILAFSVRGIFSFLSDKSKEDAFFIIWAYFALVGLKSGTLLSSWFFLAGLMYFFAVGLRLRGGNRRQRKL